jgi:hypothetical protein
VREEEMKKKNPRTKLAGKKGLAGIFSGHDYLSAFVP